MNPKPLFFFKAIFLFSVSLFIYSISFAQQKRIIYFDVDSNIVGKMNAVFYREINYDKSDKPIGIVYDRYMNGKLKWKGKFFSDGTSEKFDSTCIWYYDNMYGNRTDVRVQINRKAFFIKGKEEGTDSVFDRNGKIWQLGVYHNGERQGEWDLFNYYGVLFRRSYYKNDKLEGNDSAFYENGKINRVTSYVNGKKNGKELFWYKGGKIKSSYHYKNDSLDGEWVEFYESGCKSKIGYSQNGKLVGKSVDFNEVNCDTGVVKTYSANGVMIDCRQYDLEKRFISQVTLDTLKNISETFGFNKDGKIIMHVVEWKETKIMKWDDFFGDGKQWRTILLKDSHEIADTTWYHNGEIQSLHVYEPLSVNLVKSCAFDSLGRMTEEFCDSLLLHVAKDNYACLYGLKNIHNQWVVKPTYQRINDPKSGFFEMDLNEKWGVLDRSGKVMIAPQYDYVDIIDGAFGELMEGNVKHMGSYGRLVAEKNGIYGVVNFHNEVVLPFEYSGMSFYSYGVLYLSKNNSFGFCNLTTGFVSEMKYNRTLYFNNDGFAIYSADEEGPYYNPYQHEQLYNFGMVDLNGKTIIPPVFDEIMSFGEFDNSSERINSRKLGNLYLTIKNEKYGLYNSDGKMLLDTLYDVMTFVEDSIALVSQNKKYGIVGADGHIIVPVQYDSLMLISTEWAIYKKDNKYGLLGKNMKPISQPIYSSIQIYSKGAKEQYGDIVLDNSRCTFIAQLNGKFGLINEKDSVLVPFEYERAWIPEDYYNAYGAFLIKKNHLYVFFHDTLFTSKNFKKFFDFHNGKASFCGVTREESGYSYFGYGIIKEDGTILLQPHYTIISNNDAALVFQDSTRKNGIIDKSGKMKMLPTSFTGLSADKRFLWFTNPSGKIGAMDMNGKIVIDTIYYMKYRNPNENLYWVKSTPIKFDRYRSASFSGDWGIIDSTGKSIVKTEWDFPAYFSNSVMINSSHGKFGVVREDGKILIKPIYDKIYRDNSGYFILEQNGTYGFASSEGKIIAEPKWKDVSGFLGNVMLVYDTNGVALIDTTGKIIEKADSCSKFKTNLSEQIVFNMELFYGITLSAQLNLAISKFDSLEKISNQDGKIAAENLVIGWAAMNYKYSLSSHRSENVSVGNYDYSFYPSYSLNENNSLGNKYYQFKVFVDSATSATFSMTMVTVSNPLDNASTVEVSARNYDARSGTLEKLELKDLFDTTKNYRATLNSLIGDAVHEMDGVEIDCSNPAKYIDEVGENFCIGENGITFYVHQSDAYNWMYEEANRFMVFVPYSKMKNIIGKKSVLNDVMKK